MKRLLAIAAAALALAAPTAMHAGQGLYIGIEGGPNWLDFNKAHHTNADTGYTIACMTGYKFCNGFTGELEGNYRCNRWQRRGDENKTGASHKHVQSWSYMGNVYYDLQNALNTCWANGWRSCWDPCWRVSPYVGAGAGYDQVHRSQRNSGFAYQVMAGLSYSPAIDWDILLEYKFHQRNGKAFEQSVTWGARKYFICCF